MISLTYDGENFNGFQKQTGKENENIQTIAGILEEKLTVIFQKPMKSIASGRTDTGVHAREQVVTFPADADLVGKITLPSLKRMLNRALPKEIFIAKINPCLADFHPRYAAKVRLYRYSMVINNFNQFEPYQLKHCYSYPFPLKNLTLLERYFQQLEGEHDFTTFSSLKTTMTNKVRKIFKIDLISKPPLLNIEIYGNAFLRSMVRSIIGNVLFAYQKKMKPKILKEWLAEKNPLLAKNRVPAKGLTLKKVFYTQIF